MCLLGLVFRAGISNSIRGGIYAGIGLAGLNIIINAATDQLTPAIQAFSENFNTNLTVTDLGWGLRESHFRGRVLAWSFSGFWL